MDLRIGRGVGGGRMVRASTHPTGENLAALRVNCRETVLHIPGCLRRFRDMPAEMGGRGRCWRSQGVGYSPSYSKLDGVMLP